jgi:tryptophan halogenase
MSEAQATDALIEGNRPEERLGEPRAIPMRVGRSRNSWVGNCVAIGLASGFLEPLESTSIQFVDYACRRLLRMLPSLDFEPQAIAKFNWEMEQLYEEVRDFLGLHFTLGNREDTPYWRAVRHEAKRSDTLQHCLELWTQALPDAWDRRPSTVFNFWSVSCVLVGKGFYKGPVTTGSDLLLQSDWQRHVKRMAAMQNVLVDSLPDHAAMLRDIVAGATPGATVNKRPAQQGVPSPVSRLGRDMVVMSSDAF